MAKTTMKSRLENILALLDIQYLEGIDMAFSVDYLDRTAFVYITDKANGNNKTWFCSGSVKSCIDHLDASRDYLRMIYCNLKNARAEARPIAIPRSLLTVSIPMDDYEGTGDVESNLDVDYPELYEKIKHLVIPDGGK